MVVVVGQLWPRRYYRWFNVIANGFCRQRCERSYAVGVPWHLPSLSDPTLHNTLGRYGALIAGVEPRIVVSANFVLLCHTTEKQLSLSSRKRNPR
jgi:hypothetical protein